MTYVAAPGFFPCCFAIAATVFFLPSANAGNLLFDPVADIIETQAFQNPIFRARLQSHDAFVVLLVVRQADRHLALNESVVLPLEKDLNITVTLISVEQPTPDLSFWHAALTDPVPQTSLTPAIDPTNSILITQYNQNITAAVRYNGQLYQIMPISAELYTVVKVTEREAK